MLPLLLIILIAASIYGPQFWAKHVLSAHSGKRDNFPGTGIELGEHLISSLSLSEVQVEVTESADYYDPVNKILGLSRKHCDKKSLTAVVVTAHEIGHAIQDKEGYQPLYLRTKWVKASYGMEKIGAALMMALPVVAGLTRIPSAGVLMFLGGLMTLGIPVIIHLITLPVEWDASFNRALPLLKKNLRPEEIPAAQKILTACALTYVAASLASLLNLWRWIKILRR